MPSNTFLQYIYPSAPPNFKYGSAPSLCIGLSVVNNTCCLSSLNPITCHFVFEFTVYVCVSSTPWIYVKFLDTFFENFLFS